MYVAGNFAGRANAAIQCIGILHIEGFTKLAAGQEEFVVVGNAVQQIPGPFEVELWLPVQYQVGFIGTTQTVAKFYVGARPASMDSIILVDA